MEAEASRSETIGADLGRMAEAVATGDADLKTLGFWKLVGQVKTDPSLVERYADRIGAIDTAAFQKGVPLRIPIWTGNLLLAAGTVAGGVAAGLAVAGTFPAAISGLLLLAAGGIWSVSLHSSTHWVVGRITGMRFVCYFASGKPPKPGVKTDYGTYLRVKPAARAWMHASGAIASKIAPFLALALWPSSDAPWWSAAGLLVLGVTQIITDVLFSTKSSDWKKFKREMAIARRAKQADRPPAD